MEGAAHHMSLVLTLLVMESCGGLWRKEVIC